MKDILDHVPLCFTILIFVIHYFQFFNLPL